MSPKRKVIDGSDIWARILDELGWDSPNPGQLNEDEIAERLQISQGAALRALEWAYEEGFVGWIRCGDGTLLWHRRMPRKGIVRREIFGQRDYCLRCDTIGGHEEGCIHG